MLKSVKTSAEAKFAVTQKKDKPAPKEKDKARQERAEHVAGLRALRLAKEAADKKTAKKAAAKKAAAKNSDARLRALRLAKEASDKKAAEKAAAKNIKPSRSPQAHRR